MFKILQGVSFDGGPPGQAFGGGIYGVSCDIATSQDSSKITLNIVSENGSYFINPGHLNVTSTGPRTLQIGSGMNAITFYHMYVYKYNYNQTSSSKTLSVTLIDHSVAFDKIFVGLSARHDTSSAEYSIQSYPFNVLCTECNKIWPKDVQVNGITSRGVLGTQAGKGIAVSGPGGINGGYIILGQEQWTDGKCEIPKVEYTFEELCLALEYLGYLHNLRRFNRSNLYQASYTGTLREVLNSWASDFSFSFIVDSTVPILSIVGSDLTIPIDLTMIKIALNTGFGSNSNGGLIRSRSDSVSLENTYTQRSIVKNIKPARTFSRQHTSYTRSIGKPLSVREALGNTGDYGRTEEQLKISIALARYKSEARILWLSDQAASNASGRGPTGGVDNPCWKSLGFIPAKPTGAQGPFGIFDLPIDPNNPESQTSRKAELLKLFKQKADHDNFEHPIWDNKDNYYIYIGVFNETLQRAIESFDNELAEFYNKYAYWYGKPFNQVTKNFNTSAPDQMVNPPPSFRQCPDVSTNGNLEKFYDYSAKISTLPDSKLYKLSSYPFQDILRANSGVFNLTGGGVDPDGDSIFSLDDNAWGTNKENIDNLFANQWIYDTSNTNFPDKTIAPQSDLDHFLPIFARFDSDEQMNISLRNILPNFKLDFMKNHERLNGYFPGIAIVPKIDKIVLKSPLKPNDPPQRVLEVGNIISQYNPLVYDNTRRRRLEMVGNSEKECTLYCEEDIVADVCECPPAEDPLHRFSSYFADSFVVKHLGTAASIIFPVGSDYIGFWKSEITNKGTYPKRIEIRGAPSTNIPNVMESRVMDVDVTQEIDPVGNMMLDQFVVRNHLTPIPIDLNTYYFDIASTDRDSLFPTESINVKIDGLEFSTLYGFLGPQSGLTGFSIGMDSEGLATDLTFSTRPSKMPKRDVLMQKIGPRATQGRTGGSRSPATGNPGSGVSLPFLP